MSLEDDVEFRDLLSQTLEVNGCLAKIRAQLRASIFLTLDENEELQRKEPLANLKVKTCLETPEGQIMFCLVREFLEFFNLDFTLSVYNVETYADTCYNYGGRSDIIEKLGILADDSNYPLIWQLINNVNSHSKFSKKSDSDCLSNISEITNESHQSCNSSSSIAGLSPITNIAGANSSLNTTYNINTPTVGIVSNSGSSNHALEMQKTPDLMPTLNKVSDSDTSKSEDSIHTEYSNQLKIVTDKSNSSSELKEERPESSKSEKSRSKSSSNFLSDLPPLQINKSKSSESPSPLLPSLYNIGKDKANSKEVDKLLSFDDSTLDESVSVSLVNSSEIKSVYETEHESRDTLSVDIKEETKNPSCNSNKSSESDESKKPDEISLSRENN